MKKLSIIKFLFFLALSPTTFLYAQSHKEKIIQKKRELRLAEKTYKDAEKKFNSLRDELYQLRLKNGYWTRQGFLGINFSRAEFNNWAAGGANSYAVNSTLTCKADYKQNKFTWENLISGFNIKRLAEFVVLVFKRLAEIVVLILKVQQK